jgi:hypothetical protein
MRRYKEPDLLKNEQTDIIAAYYTEANKKQIRQSYVGFSADIYLYVHRFGCLTTFNQTWFLVTSYKKWRTHYLPKDLAF